MASHSTPTIRQIGNYEVIEKIAEGGMGTVYKAKQAESGQIVAVKVLSNTARNPVLLKRFKQEFDVASMLDHPNVVRAIEYSGDAESPFLVMEFVDGESLGQKVERDGAISEEESLRIIAQVCQGLHKAHKFGLVHRDIKPDNILINAEGQAKLTDLGLVKNLLEEELNLTRTGRGLGTPYYMAPEQFRNAKNADVRCDVYSLAATLYAMVTGETPFGKLGPLDCWMKKHNNEFPSPRSINPAISERVDWAIRRAMSGEPDMRPATCREFFEDLIGQSAKPLIMTQAGETQIIWYMVYRDETGQQHTVKGSTEAIRKAIRDGLLGDASNVRTCRTKQGPFESLMQYPEFRDLLVAPKAARPLSSTPTSTPSSARLSRSRPLGPNDETDPEAIALGETPEGVSSPSASWQATPPRPEPRSGRLGTPPPRPEPRSGRLGTPPPRPVVRKPSTSGPLPHIPVDPATMKRGSEWVIWVVVLAVAVGSALAGAMFLR